MTTPYTPYLTLDIQIPPGFKWLGQDHSGQWYVYTHMPIKDISTPIWTLKDTEAHDCIRIGNGLPPKDWTQELYKLS